MSVQAIDAQNKKYIHGENVAQKLLDVVHDNHDLDEQDKKKHTRRKCCWFTCGIFLALLAIQLTFVPHLLTKSIRKGIEDAFIFTKPEPDNSHYHSWTTNHGGVPIKFSIQFFNVTNPDQVLKHGAHPQLKLTRPIVYDQYYTRQHINFSADGEYVNQTFFTEYLYNDKESEIDPNMLITILSPLVGTLWHQWDKSGRIKKDAMQELMKILVDDPSVLFWRRKAVDLIWSIYDFDHFGFHFHYGFMRNQSNQYYKLHTGHNDHKRMGEVQRWCRSPLTMDCLYNESAGYVSFWDPPMSISPGHLFYEGVYALTDLEDKNALPPLWIDILFRDIYLQYNGTYMYKDIELYKYGIQFTPQFSNTTLYPPNAQFNQFGPSGLLNSSAAYDDISLYLSMVLFYGAPDYMANNTKMGLPPPGPHDYPFMDIEPKTGAIFYANASMQICSIMHSLPNINNVTVKTGKGNLFNLTDDLMVPIYLVTFSDAVTNSIANNFKSNIGLGEKLHTASIVVGWTAVALLLIWSFVTVFGAGVYYHGYKMRSV